jgi:hypothetical protein
MKLEPSAARRTEVGPDEAVAAGPDQPVVPTQTPSYRRPDPSARRRVALLQAATPGAYCTIEVEVCLRRRTHTPALLEAGYNDRRVEIPWWGGLTLSYSLPAR